MSYEGYEQVLCENGHYATVDCYNFDEDWRCFYCGAKAKWTNGVNLTNGCVDENGEDISGHIDITPYLKTPVSVCKHCGCKNGVEVYDFPTEKGILL